MLIFNFSGFFTYGNNDFAAPASSSEDVPFIESVDKKAAISTSEASPEIKYLNEC